MGRKAAALASLAIAGAVALPVVGGPGHDSYPLSTYPMFARDRGRTSVLDTAVATDRDGRELTLRPELIGGTHEPVHAAATVSEAVAGGHAARLCTEVAARVAHAGPDRATSVQVVTLTYDAVAWFSGDHVPEGRLVRAACGVPR
jgi:hypothetical protein